MFSPAPSAAAPAPGEAARIGRGEAWKGKPKLIIGVFGAGAVGGVAGASCSAAGCGESPAGAGTGAGGAGMCQKKVMLGPSESPFASASAVAFAVSPPRA